MHRIRIFILLLFLLSPFSNNSFAHSKAPSKEEIKKTAKLAVKYLHSENFEKSEQNASDNI